MTHSDQERFRAKIEALRLRFDQTLAERAGDVHDVLSAWDGTEPRSDADWHKLRYAAHKTAGLAATFGYGELGGVSVDLERALNTEDLTSAEARKRVRHLAEEFVLLARKT